MRKEKKERKIRCKHLDGVLQEDNIYSSYYSVENGILNKDKAEEKTFNIGNRQFICKCGNIIKNENDEKLKKLINQL
jgi:hypothetical protein